MTMINKATPTAAPIITTPPRDPDPPSNGYDTCMHCIA